MKRSMNKFFSAILALVMLCSVVVLPASALEGGNVEIAFSVEKHNGVDTAGATADDIYALTISFKNDHPINAFVMPVYYNSKVFTPIDGTDMAIMDWGYTIDFDAGLTGVGYEAKGDLADAKKYNKSNALPGDRVVNARGAIAGLGSSSAKKVLDIVACNPSDPNLVHFWGGMSQDGIGAIYLNYETGANTCNIQAYDTLTPFVTLFFKANAGATAEQIKNARFGFYAESTKNCFDSTVEGDTTKFYFDAESTSYVPAAVSGECTMSAPAGPAVAKSKGQIKMTKTGADTVADDFSFRVISKITDTDWDKYFSGTLDSDTELGATNAIQKVGFVVAESGNFAMDAAKAAAKKYAESANPDAEDLGVYKVATTNFIQKTDDASDAFFACRIDTSVLTKSDRKYIAFVQYKDGDGNIQYAFYDEAQEILLDSKYGDYKAAWLSQNQG